MTSNGLSLILRRLTFTGPDSARAELSFSPGLGVLYGASNTGKSFTVKAIDFMLGGSRELPGIEERRAYDQAWLVLELPKSGTSTFVRALRGGPLELYAGDVNPGDENGLTPRQLSAKHDAANLDNVSNLLLDELGLAGREVVVDSNGKKRSLSFRDLVRFCIVDETEIQSETSPALSGQYQSSTVERSVFRMLVTGVDDSAVRPIVDRKTFRTSTTAKLEVVDEMISGLDEEIAADFPNADQIGDQSRLLEETWRRAQREFEVSQQSIRTLLFQKRGLAGVIARLEDRQTEIHVNIARFGQLEEVYQSDIRRLEAIEETGFLLGLGGDRDCPLCGASPEHQRNTHGLAEIERTRAAAGAEIAKIRQQSVELQATLDGLHAEAREVEQRLGNSHHDLVNLEAELRRLAPAASSAKARLQETLATRDRVRTGLSLLEQRQTLQKRRDRLAALRPASKSEKPRLGISSDAVHEFGQVVSSVLEQWQFPGTHHVSFEESTLDLRIDGKNRKDNGKGVRAITHAAFKVALLLFCREKNLAHPGFLVLDTPLLTYRDPLQSRGGPLSADEQALRNTSLKDFFFEHLSRNSDNGQFLVIENIDLPEGIEQLADIEVFTGDLSSGRTGLF